MPKNRSPRTHRELGQVWSDKQVEILRSIRAELSHRRWQVMLEIDSAQEELTAARRACHDPTLERTLAAVSARLAQAHRQLARIPEDVIPAF